MRNNEIKKKNCGCGCGGLIPERDNRNRPHDYVFGHGNKGKTALWCKKLPTEVNRWHTRHIARTIFNGERICFLRNLGGCSTYKINIHHKDGNIWNNSPNNLIPLCVRHHSLVEKKYISIENPIMPKYYIFPNGRIIYSKNKQYPGGKK